MIFFSTALAAVPPSLSDIEGFNPGQEDGFINPESTASAEVIDHWLFSTALPEWISYLITFAAGFAILMIVVGGVMLMLNPEVEEMKTRGYKTITWALAGLVISVMAFSIVEIVNLLPFTGSNPETGLDIDTDGGVDNLAQGDLRSEIIPQAIQLILQIIGSIALGLILYAGVLLVLRDGNEERVTKARRLLIYSFVGITVALLAYLVVEAVIQLNFERG